MMRLVLFLFTGKKSNMDSYMGTKNIFALQGDTHEIREWLTWKIAETCLVTDI